MIPKFVLVLFAIILPISLLLNLILLAEFFILSNSSDQKNIKIGELNGLLEQSKNTITTLNRKNKYLQSKLDSANKNISLSTQLFYSKLDEINSLNNSLIEKESELKLAKSKLTHQQEKLNEISSEVNILSEKINDSMSWFSENSYLPENYSWNIDILEQRIENNCVYDDNLNLACITHLMETTAINLRYKEDGEQGNEDHLQSIKQTADRSGGDCEDFALFFKAILNSLKKKIPQVNLIAWYPSEGANFQVYPYNPKAEEYFYYSNARGKNLGKLSELNIYEICFSITNYSGHCAVALTKSYINISKNIHLLNNAKVFESQDGMYLGSIEEDYHFCESNDQDACWSVPNTIMFIISNNDIYQFSKKNWVGYADFFAKISSFSSTFD